MIRVLALLAAAACLTGCQSAPLKPLPSVAHVDLARFMGDWYVIASIPTAIERGAHNAVESYRLDADGTVATTFTFRAGSFDGALKRYHPRGYVRDRASNAIWGMQFVWPFKADYRIAYLSEDYGRTVIARERRDYVWIMARTPTLSEEAYRDLLHHVADLGYDVTQVRRVPQRWDGSAPGP
ncbi:MAG: lipocalin family protein [Proteobacteria bacterium]|nr:lipocalin family protein [Pseudomonadota bacterium]